ncbi:Syd protein [Streptomyces sp. NBRC 110611]|uniref:effector-associated constant component EACC1 n=1 Tax=Streptomyces sp. NBRC 110611 TaxID=1621259 RepID=UPI00082BBAE1|nr:hypothetical protein [Streptomyces sp. NBRC 110611]GAU66016.1 Syd protein [Streptomyces sp. NBRC 110611]
MEIRLTLGSSAGEAGGGVDGRDGAEGTASLYRWLVADPELRGRAEVSAGAAPTGQGEMGGALEVVNVVFGDVIALGNLLVAVAAWRGSRPRPPQVRIERDGVSITVQDGSPETVERILKVWGMGGSGDTPGPDREDTE